MPRHFRSQCRRYGGAVASVVFMTALWAALRPMDLPYRPFIAFYFAVIFSAWYGGLGPSIAAVVLACASALYFFIPPYHALAASNPNDLIAMAMFVTVCSAIIAFSESSRAARRRLEEEVADRKKAEASLRESDRHKEQFLAVLSHELRNPLAAIQASVDVLEQRTTTESPPELGMISRQVYNLRRLVDDLLDVSKISRGQIELRKEIVEVGPVVVQAVEVARPIFDERRQRLHLFIPKESIYLEADSTRLEQILFNLLTNSARYTPQGGQIWLAVEPSPKDVLIRVRDTGIGMKPELMPKVFELFQRGERGTSAARAGSGIGLNLVKKLVELHGGTIAASSAGPDKGSEFVVRLPIAPVPRPIPPPASQTLAIDQPQTFPSRRVLIVDDNVPAADSLGKLMALAFGQEVRVVYNAADALEQAATFLPHLVLLDLELAGTDGYEVGMRLRELPGCAQTVLVAVTGWGHEDDRRRSEELGFDRHLVKPVTAKDLRKLLAELQPKLQAQAVPQPVQGLAHS